MKIGKILLIAAVVAYVAAIFLTKAQRDTVSYIVYFAASVCLVIGWSRYKREK